jgi:hypothetical protein
MNKEFVTYEQAVVLNELKYDGDYNYTYTIDKHLWYGDVKADGVSTLAAPLKQQVFRWFREKYDLLGYIDSDTMEHGIEYSYHINILKQGDTWFKLYIDTYEEAEERCIDKLIEIAKQQDNG